MLDERTRALALRLLPEWHRNLRITDDQLALLKRRVETAPVVDESRERLRALLDVWQHEELITADQVEELGREIAALPPQTEALAKASDRRRLFTVLLGLLGTGLLVIGYFLLVELARMPDALDIIAYWIPALVTFTIAHRFFARGQRLSSTIVSVFGSCLLPVALARTVDELVSGWLFNNAAGYLGFFLPLAVVYASVSVRLRSTVLGFFLAAALCGLVLTTVDDLMNTTSAAVYGAFTFITGLFLGAAYLLARSQLTYLRTPLACAGLFMAIAATFSAVDARMSYRWSGSGAGWIGSEVFLLVTLMTAGTAWLASRALLTGLFYTAILTTLFIIVVIMTTVFENQFAAIFSVMGAGATLIAIVVLRIRKHAAALTTP